MIAPLTLQERVSRATLEAREVIAKHGFVDPCIVVETKLPSRNKTLAVGFRFQSAKVGDELANDDGTISIVHAVVQ